MDVRLTRDHPLRPVDWRYQKARDLLLRNGLPTWHGGEDPWKDLFRFLRKLACCQDERSRSGLMRESQRFWFAFEIYCDPESDLTAIVEARLLAGEPIDRIGAKLGFTGAVIETFAQCYFDVQTRLGLVDFVHSHVLNRNSNGNQGRSERELALKRIGYCAGAKTLDRVLRTPGRLEGSATAESTIQGLADHVEDLLFDRVLTAIGSMENTDEKAVRALTQLYARLEAARQNSPDSSSGYEEYLKNVEAVLKEIPWKLASKGSPKVFEPWQKYATELRAHEMLQIAAGEEGPTHQQMSLRILPAGADPDAAPKA